MSGHSKKRFGIPLFWLIPLFCCGCVPENPHLRFALAALWSGADQILWHLLLWTVILTVLGAAAGFFAFMGLRAMGAYPYKGPRARAFKAVTLAVMILVFGVCGSLGGFLEGCMSGARATLRSNRACRLVYRPITDTTADLTAALYLSIQEYQGRTGRFQVSPAKLSHFRAGKWELNVPDFMARTRRLTQETLRQAFASVREMGETLCPESDPSILGGILLIMEKSLASDLGMGLTTTVAGACLPVPAVGKGMMVAAERSGDPNTLSRAELSDVMADRLLIRPCLSTLRPHIAPIELGLLGVMLAVTVLPVLGFWLLDRLYQSDSAGPSGDIDFNGYDNEDWF